MLHLLAISLSGSTANSRVSTVVLSESRGLIILPATGSRGNCFGPLLPPVAVTYLIVAEQ